jgi:hypothetical protein
LITQISSALWLALAGGHYRVTGKNSKAEVVGGQSSIVLRKRHREARKKLHERRVSSRVAWRGYRAAVNDFFALKKGVCSWSQ